MKFNFGFLEKFKKKKFVCPGAFSQAYIYHDGRVYLCPDCLMSQDSCIGNLNEKTFEEIWNSKKAVKLRKEILKGKYTHCSPAFCYSKSNYNIRVTPMKDIDFSPIQKKFPQMVCLGPDWECNANCIMCRKELVRLTEEELKECNRKIESLYLPILKDAKEITLSTTGDPFASRNTRLLAKTVAEKYPNIKFNLITNGILCNEFNCDEIGITNRLSRVMVSMHAADEETYNKVVKNGNFSKVLENLEWLKSMKAEHKIKGLYLAFVINSKNYKNIPDFIEFAKKHGTEALFWHCIEWGDNLNNDDEPLNITRMDNPKFEDLRQLLATIELETPHSHFGPIFKTIKDSATK